MIFPVLEAPDPSSFSSITSSLQALEPPYFVLFWIFFFWLRVKFPFTRLLCFTAEDAGSTLCLPLKRTSGTPDLLGSLFGSIMDKIMIFSGFASVWITDTDYVGRLDPPKNRNKVLWPCGAEFLLLDKDQEVNPWVFQKPHTYAVHSAGSPWSNQEDSQHTFYLPGHPLLSIWGSWSHPLPPPHNP